MTKGLSRRVLLRGAGLSVALPLLAQTKGARGASSPKRLIVYFVPNGTVHAHWNPQRAASDAQKPAAERDFALGRILSPLERHKLDMLLLTGIDNIVAGLGPNDGHRDGMGSLLTGMPLEPLDAADPKPTPARCTVRAPSIDQVFSRTLEAEVPLRSLHLGSESLRDLIAALSFSGDGNLIGNTARLDRVFESIFGDGMASAQEQAKRRAAQASLLDGVLEDYRALSARLGGEDKQRVERHLEAMRAVEKRLRRPNACTGSMALPASYARDDLPAFMKDAAELIALAFACDATRVVTLVPRRCGGGQSYLPWLGTGAEGKSSEHHELSHLVPKQMEPIDRMFQWFSEPLAHLIDQLKETPDAGGGSVFDSTLVLYVSENAENHRKKGLPLALFGSLGGALKTGRWLDFGGRPHNQFLATVLTALGVPTERFGHADAPSGLLPGVL